MELKELVGKHILQGIELCETEHVGCVKFTLDDITYMAVENPSDGYRSYCDDLVVVNESCLTKLPNIEVMCCHITECGYGNGDLLDFIDANNGKRFLRIGTENVDDYYPCCVFDYTPENLSCNENRE